MRATLTYHDTPPSANRNNGVGGRGDPRTIARTKSKWQNIFIALLHDAGVPKNLRHVTARPRLEFKTRHRRDADNYYQPISKPLGDAFVRGGWLPDDTPLYYKCERVEIIAGVAHHLPLVTSSLIIELEFLQNETTQE